MNEEKSNRGVAQSASIISRLLFCWVLPFFKLGYGTDNIQSKDLGNADTQDASSTLTELLEKMNVIVEDSFRNWRDENTSARIKNTTPKLRKVILKTFVRSYALFGLLMLLQYTLIKTMLPIVLAEYLKYFEGDDISDNTGWCLGAAQVILALADVFLYHHCQVGNSRIGMRARTACSSMCFRKILRLSQSSLEKIDSNRVGSLFSEDIMKLGIALSSQPHLLVMPIHILGAIFVLYDCVGIAGLAGILLMVVQSVPLQCCLSRIQSIFIQRITLMADQRVTLTREIINAIQTIKLNAWEQPFEKMVMRIWKLELDQARKLTYIKAFTDSLSVLSEYAAILVTLAMHILLGNQLKPSAVFTTILVFRMLHHTCSCFQEALVAHAGSKAVIEELEWLLALEEKGHQTRVISCTKNRKAGSVRTTDASAAWGPTIILKGINIKLSAGKLCCLVGWPGSGRTSLLLMLLKEMPVVEGKVDLIGTVSYAPQEPWVFPGSIKANILFGTPYNRSKYRTIIKACGLDRDFSEVPEGDKTVLLDRGLGLNGAQRARISLARAVYSDANVYLFDDCFSKMNPQLVKYISMECIQKYLGNKTRIVVTDQMELIREANLVLVLENGTISKVMKNQDWTESDLNELKSKFFLADSATKSPQQNIERRRPSISSTCSSLPKLSNREDVVNYNSCNVLIDYFKAGANTCSLGCVFILFVISQTGMTLSHLWITYWVDANSTRYDQRDHHSFMYTALVPNILYTSGPEPKLNISPISTEGHKLFGIQEDYFFIYVLAAIVVTSLLLFMSRSFVFRTVCLVATKIIYGSVFVNLLRGSMHFFLTSTPETILNTFSEDLGFIKFDLPEATMHIVHLQLMQVGIVVTIFLASPLTVVPAVLVVILSIILVKYVSKAVQTVQELERISGVPKISHIYSTIRGVSIIRSSAAEKIITDEFDTMQDKYNSFWWLRLMMCEAFGFYLNVCFIFFLAAVTFHFNALKNEHTLVGCVGLAVSQSIALIGLLHLEIRQSMELSSNLASAQRILAYTMLPKEIPDDQVRYTPTNWPHFGKIVFRNTCLRYSPEEPPILNNFNMVALPAEKVGIIGREGSGKSSVIAALFRLAPTEGLITVDDVDTSVTSLNALRSSITLVSPDPILFSPTVKFNLDPFDELADEVLWKALEEVELTGVIGTLSHPVSENGSNLSLVTRQQICLAQAILRKNKILVLDMTSEIDPRIDLLVRKIVTEVFNTATVLWITDRPALVVQCDKVVVLESGRTTACGHAHALLQQQGGQLARMVAEERGGNEAEKQIRQLAKKDYEMKHLGIEFTFDKFE